MSFEPIFVCYRELLLGLNASTEPRKTKTVRFSDQIVEPDELDNSQVLQLQQRIIQGKKKIQLQICR